MVETQTYQDVLPSSVLERYSFIERGSASAIASAVCKEEFSDVIKVLGKFSLTSALLLSPGGNRGIVPRLIDEAFGSLGWTEARIDLFRRAFLFRGNNAPDVEDDPMGTRAAAALVSEIYQHGYAVDNVKGRLALDVEWNPKDGNLDRDFAAYRAWHNEGLIDAAILISRIQQDTRELAKTEWDRCAKERVRVLADVVRPDPFRTTTTANFEKARERVLRGDLGTCPILVIGIGKKTWDSEPWDGYIVKYDKNTGCLYKSPYLGGNEHIPYPGLLD